MMRCWSDPQISQSVAAEHNRPKRALVLGGGGAFAAFEIGCLLELTAAGDCQYDYIYGVSGGALNGAMVGMYGKGKEHQAAQDIAEVWRNLRPSDMFKNWIGCCGGCCKMLSMGYGAVMRRSLTDSSPMRRSVEGLLDIEKIRQTRRLVAAGACNVRTGRYRMFDTSHDRFVDAVSASAAVPGYFEPVRIDGEDWVDGGLRDNAPLKAALLSGAQEIDILVSHPYGIQALLSADEHDTTLEILSRGISIMSNEILNNDIRVGILESQRRNKGTRFRIIRPSLVIGSSFMTVDPVEIRQRIEHGQQRARETLLCADQGYMSEVAALSDETATHAGQTPIQLTPVVGPYVMWDM